MKEKLKSEAGAANIIEAIIILPVVFLCVFFLLFSGLTFVQRAILQSNADRLAQYISKCISYPGYSEIIDPFYGEKKEATMSDRITAAMEISDPYRYMLGWLGLNGTAKEMPEKATTEMIDNGYLKSVSFIVPKDDTVIYPAELENMYNDTGDGYICAITANTSTVTVYLGQNYVFAEFFRMIGMGGKRQMLFGKSTSNVTDVPEMVRLVDFSFETIESMITTFGGENGVDFVQKVKDTIKKISGNE